MSDAQLSKRKRKAKESWASKKVDKKSKTDENLDTPINPVVGEVSEKKKQKKKEEGETKKAQDKAVSTSTDPATDSTETTATKTKENVQKNKRFILFVGNLSFKTTKEDILAHIEPTGVKPTAVRLQTDPATKRPKGFAFIDLPDFMALDRVLNLHHTSLGGRKINVELTAGGGGSGEKRKAKIAKKNEKLDVERETAMKTKREAEVKKVRGKSGKTQEDKTKREEDLGDVNPARRRRIA